MAAPFISICVPAYEMAGEGAKCLAAMFETLVKQRFTDFEVVISDQSKDESVKRVCDLWSERLAIRHIWNREAPRQASANVNNAILHAKGTVCKIIFQDDLLHGAEALELIAGEFSDPEAIWLLCGSAVTRDGETFNRPMIPRMNPRIHFGKNTVSSPSVLAFRRDKTLSFDENLIWLMDVDVYKRYELEYGPPQVLPQVLVLNRLHDGQVSAGVLPELRRRELNYTRAKFRTQERIGDRFAYWKQYLKAR